MMKVKPGDWIAWCAVCKGGAVLIRNMKMRERFVCWNCGPEDIRKIPGVEVYA